MSKEEKYHTENVIRSIKNIVCGEITRENILPSNNLCFVDFFILFCKCLRKFMCPSSGTEGGGALLGYINWYTPSPNLHRRLYCVNLDLPLS